MKPLTENQVICGNRKDKKGHISVTLTSSLAVKQFKQLVTSPPDDAGKCALKLLSIFFADDMLARGNCTKADGREFLDQSLLQGINVTT